MKEFTQQLWVKNPILVYLTGLSILLGSAVNFETALIAGLIATITMFITTSILHTLHIDELPARLLIGTMCSTIAFAYIQNPYILLIGVSSLITQKNTTILASFGKGIGFTLIASIVGIIREISSTGALHILNTTIIQDLPHHGIFLSPGWTLIVLAICIAGVRAWK
ncbi:hypothetical protein H6504_02720 [Candidatus Woesearchaeota archaeon]|nr:hypothetical protein [Candidatus Woesearchaeota archaeon]